MGQKKSNSISRDLLQLYRRCVVHNLIHCPLVIFIFIFICTCMFFSSVSTCYWTSMFSSFVVFITYEVVKLCFPISILWLPFFFFWGCWMLPGRSKFCSSTTGREYFGLVSEVSSCKNLCCLLWFLLCKCGWHEQAEKYFPAPLLFFPLTFLVLNNLELTRISLCISLLCADATKLAKACQQQIAVRAVAP